MSKPQTTTVAIWISVLGFLLTIGTVVLSGGRSIGGETQRVERLERDSSDQEQRIRSLEADRAIYARTQQKIEALQVQVSESARKIDQMYQWIVPPGSRKAVD